MSSETPFVAMMIGRGVGLFKGLLLQLTFCKDRLQLTKELFDENVERLRAEFERSLAIASWGKSCEAAQTFAFFLVSYCEIPCSGRGSLVFRNARVADVENCQGALAQAHLCVTFIDNAPRKIQVPTKRLPFHSAFCLRLKVRPRRRKRSSRLQVHLKLSTERWMRTSAQRLRAKSACGS